VSSSAKVKSSERKTRRGASLHAKLKALALNYFSIWAYFQKLIDAVRDRRTKREKGGYNLFFMKTASAQRHSPLPLT
jgi:hypothetical protein